MTVLFLLHAYETLFLIRERHGDRRRLEQLERARLAAELENMKGQLAPHFLFNCLATLAAELAPAQFFRVNRNFLAHAAAVRSFSSVGKGRLAVQLLPRPAGEVLVSQENAAAFRAWASR